RAGAARRMRRTAPFTRSGELRASLGRRELAQLARDRLCGENDELAPGPRAPHVQICRQVLAVLVAQLGEDHHGPLETFEPVNALGQDCPRLDVVGEPKPVDAFPRAEPALGLSRRREDHDVLQWDLLGLYEVAQDDPQKASEVLIVAVAEDLRRAPLRPTRRRP